MFVVHVKICTCDGPLERAFASFLVPMHTDHAVLHEFRCQRRQVTRLHANTASEHFCGNRSDTNELVHHENMSVFVEQTRNHLCKPSNLGHLFGCSLLCFDSASLRMSSGMPSRRDRCHGT